MKTAYLFSALFVIATAPSYAFNIKPELKEALHGVQDDKTVSATDLVKDLQKGETFQQDTKSYTVYPQLQGSFAKKAAAPVVTNAAPAVLEESDVLLKDNHLVIRKMQVTAVNPSVAPSDNLKNPLWLPRDLQPKNALGTKSEKTAYQVVLNNSTGKFGILTGAIIVQTKDAVAFSVPGFSIKKSYPQQGFYIVNLPAGKDIDVALNELNNNASIVSATVEVIENFQKPL